MFQVQLKVLGSMFNDDLPEKPTKDKFLEKLICCDQPVTFRQVYQPQ